MCGRVRLVARAGCAAKRWLLVRVRVVHVVVGAMHPSSAWLPVCVQGSLVVRFVVVALQHHWQQQQAGVGGVRVWWWCWWWVLW